MKFVYLNSTTTSTAQKSIRLLFLILGFLLISSCNYKEELVDVQIVDPIRHYYPIIQGEKLNIIVELENKSDSPFKISDVLTSCGCIILKKGADVVIPANSSGFIELAYDSNKNIGSVNHFIYIYGNLNAMDKLEANFDVNVVPNALYTADYEDLYRKKVAENCSADENRTSKKENEKGYYVSDDELIE